MSKNATIRPIEISEIEVFMDEIERNVLESGRDGGRSTRPAGA